MSQIPYVNCEVKEKTNKMQQLDVYYQYFLNMFRASLCPSSGEQDVCYCTWCAALVLLDVGGSGCGALRCGVWAVWKQPPAHPAEPAQHTTCSNTRLGLLKMGIMMPETCWESIDYKHLTGASCWFSLSLRNLLTMHGHRNLQLNKKCVELFVCLLVFPCCINIIGPLVKGQVFRKYRNVWICVNLWPQGGKIWDRYW